MEFPITHLLDRASCTQWIREHFHPNGFGCPKCRVGVEQARIAASTSDLVKKADLMTVQALQEQFVAELAVLRGRVDLLEVRTATLEKQQFSTTTKLNGQFIFALTAPYSYSDRRLVQGNLRTTLANNDQVTFVDVVQLTLNTSFTGKDLLTAQLLAYNAIGFNATPEGFSFIPGDGTPNNSVVIDNLAYSFPIGSQVNVSILAAGAGPADIVSSTVSPINNSAQGALSGFSFPPQYLVNNPTTGAGVAVNIHFSKNWVWDFGYVAASVPNIPTPGAGLFNGTYTLNTQLNYLSDWLDINVYYANSYTNPNFGSPVILAAGYSQILPGQRVAQISNIYASQFNFKFGKDRQFNLGGGLVYFAVQGIGSRPDFDAWSYQGTFAWNTPKGSQLGILAGVPPYTRELAGQSRNTGFIAELYYRYQVNDFISITPSLIRRVNPYNVESNPGAWIIWGIGALCFFYDYAQQISPNALVPQFSQTFQTNPQQLGVLIGVYFFSYAVMQIPIGLIVDRFGVRGPLAIAILVSAIGNLGFALSSSVGQASFFRLLMGMTAFSYVSCMKLASTWFPPSQFATLVGLTNVIGMVGGIGATAPLSKLSSQIGWCGTVGLFAGVGFCLATVVFVVVRDSRPAGQGGCIFSQRECQVCPPNRVLFFPQGFKFHPYQVAIVLEG